MQKFWSQLYIIWWLWKNKVVLERFAKEEALRLQQLVVQTAKVITTVATENE